MASRPFIFPQNFAAAAGTSIAFASLVLLYTRSRMKEIMTAILPLSAMMIEVIQILSKASRSRLSTARDDDYSS